ncbi:AraC-type DNA-binding protein [Pseudomonas jinjuensis]|uniref:AraC-type DNA-binding protein n=1 Tax=Pseudomonas jinjuensis TaxID=198616 RepID=A0A1H0GB36_9PSED|nr:AraC-type DNA-binding protein [Pseudomonas jinjuensis]
MYELTDTGAPVRLTVDALGSCIDPPGRNTDLVCQVRELIGELLVNGGATLERVADRLGMTVRRLRDALAKAGVGFNDLLTDYRSQLAMQLLLETDERIQVIVERTGFSEPSTFYRAFKRWAGETPVEFRRRGRIPVAS